MEEDNVLLSDSVLSSVKKLIGINEDDDSFDLDIMLNINAASTTLYQIGVLTRPYTITSKEDTYADLCPEGKEEIVNLMKMYFVYKVRLSFDSATLSGNVIEVLKEMIKEAEYRMMTAHNPDNTYDD